MTFYIDNVIVEEVNASQVPELAYKPVVLNAQDYYPFGMLMEGRHFSEDNGYRFGFNGKEQDNEVKGEGNQYDYGFRIYDPRKAKFLSVDPLTSKYPWYTPYQFAGNKPIRFIDLDGLEPTEPMLYWVDSPKLEKNNWGELERTIIYITEGIHRGSAFFSLPEEMMVSETWSESGETQYHYFNKNTQAWEGFDPTDMADPEVVESLAISGVALAGTAVVGLQFPMLGKEFVKQLGWQLLGNTTSEGINHLLNDKEFDISSAVGKSLKSIDLADGVISLSFKGSKEAEALANMLSSYVDVTSGGGIQVFMFNKSDDDTIIDFFVNQAIDMTGGSGNLKSSKIIDDIYNALKLTISGEAKETAKGMNDEDN